MLVRASPVTQRHVETRERELRARGEMFAAGRHELRGTGGGFETLGRASVDPVLVGKHQERARGLGDVSKRGVLGTRSLEPLPRDFAAAVDIQQRSEPLVDGGARRSGRIFPAQRVAVKTHSVAIRVDVPRRFGRTFAVESRLLRNAGRRPMIRQLGRAFGGIRQRFEFLRDSHVQRRGKPENQLIGERLPDQRVTEGEAGERSRFGDHQSGGRRALHRAEDVVERARGDLCEETDFETLPENRGSRKRFAIFARERRQAFAQHRLSRERNVRG